MSGIGDSAIGAGMGMILGGYNDRRQIKQQQKLQDMQIRGNKEMADYNKGLALDMWNDTNAEAQRKHYEDAGLNVGLMYGGSGAGGATSNAGAGGSVSGAMAATGGGKETMDGMMAMMQQAQMGLIEAQTEKTKAEATKIAGADTGLAEANIKATIANELKTQLENEYMSKGAYKDGMSGYEVRYQQEAARMYNTVADTEIKKLNLEQMPTTLQNEVKRVALEGQRVAIDAINARTAQERNEITKQIEELRRSLMIQMQGAELQMTGDKLNQQAKQHNDYMEQKDEDQLGGWFDRLMGAAVPWYTPSETHNTHEWRETHTDNEGGTRTEGGRTTTRRRG